MKKDILRNIAIVTAVFILTLSIMLVTNYFQVRGSSPLQTEVIETLKQLNDANADNPVLQEQIRQLDLLARKAYFVSLDYLMNGVYILIGMLIVFFVCLRLYYAGYKDIPEKEIDIIDEWAVKTNARKYVMWGAMGISVIAIVFVLITRPYFIGENRVEEARQATLEENNNLEETGVAFDDQFDEAVVYGDNESTETNLEESESSEQQTVIRRAMMGSGGLVVLSESDCMVDVARYFLSFTCEQSCGKCTFCRVGIRRMLDLLDKITSGHAHISDIDKLEELAVNVKKSSLCGLGKTAPNPVLTTLKYFREEYEEHIQGVCKTGTCKNMVKLIITDNCVGCTKCAKACPVDAIPYAPYEIHSIDTEKCVLCGLCIDECNFDAIKKISLKEYAATNVSTEK